MTLGITTKPVHSNFITVDLKPLIENGDSPTAIILALTIFTSALIGALAKLRDKNH